MEVGKPTLVIAFASPLHKPRVDALISELGVIDAVVYSEEDAGKVKVGESTPIILVLSGGVSRMITHFIKLNGIRNTLLLSYPGNNSLASAVSARSMLNDEGVEAAIYHMSDLRELPNVINRVNSVMRIRGSRVALLGVDDKGPIGEAFERRFNAKVDAVPMRLFEEMVNSARDSDAKAFMNDILDRLTFDIPLDKLVKVGKIYVALLSMFKNYDALAINCFPYLIKHGVTPCLALARLNEDGKLVACEYDLRSLFLMMLSRALTGHSGWIANLNDVKGNLVYMSHCTITLSMVKSARVVTHYESGNPYSITAEINADTVTVASVTQDFSRIYAFTGRLTRSGNLNLNACRTQAEVAVNFDASVIISNAPANHHVLMPGDHINELSAFAKLLGVNVVNYGNL